MFHEKRKLKKNPSENANIFSRLCYWWLGSTCYKGVMRDLEVNDLYDPVNCERSEVLGDQLEREWNKELEKKKKYETTNKNRRNYYKPSLIRCIVHIYLWPLLMDGVLIFVENIVCLNFQVIFLGWLIAYFDEESTITKVQAYCYASGIVIATVVAILASSAANYKTLRIGMKLRIACSSLLYRKTLKLSKTSLHQTAGGQILNLLSNDVQRFDLSLIHLNYIWITLIQTILITYLIWRYVGIASFAGLATCMLQTIPLQGYISKFSARLRKKIAEQTDKRIRILNELISGIQVVKMYGWEKSFERIVRSIRTTEVKLVSLACHCRGFIMNSLVFSRQITLFVTLITLVLTGNDVNARTVFTVAAYWRTLEFLLATKFPAALITAGDAHITIRRIELEEWKIERRDSVAKVSTPNYETGVTIKNLSANWIYGALPPTLNNLTLNVKHGELCALVGSVGSGKTSLLQLILGELPAATGILDLGGKTVSYASQEPWLFGGTIRDNILFGLPYAKGKYDEVVRVCALTKDFQQLPQGHLTLVGERGASLSGGQRTRINLARAVYQDADIYLLDDPLSAVDTRVGRQLFLECINRYLRKKTRILVTHQLQYLQDADTIIVLNDGCVESQGTFESLSSDNPKFANLMKSFHEGEEEPQETFRCLLSRTQLRHSIVSVGQSIAIEPEIVAEEKVTKGRMSFEVYKRYFQAGGGICISLLILLVMILAQSATSGVDYWLTFWVNQESVKQSINYTDFSSNSPQFENHLDEWHAVNDSDVLVHPELTNLFTTTTSIAIYAGILSSSVVFTLVRSTLLLRLCVNSSKSLHSQMLDNILQATIRFFNINPSGRILNRFSKDIGAIDESLPRSMLEVITTMSMALGSLVMIITSNYWMVIPAVILCGFSYVARSAYISVVQSINRLEGVVKSPVFSHVNYSLDGLLTVRSSGAEQRMVKEFDDLQNLHTSVSCMNIAISRAFAFYLNSLVAVLVTIVCFIFIMLGDEDTKSGYVGLAISQCIGLAEIIQFGLRKSVQIISEMTSMERILQYTNLPKEGPFDSISTTKPPSNWPRFGTIAIENLTLKYDDNKPAVLKNINIHINHGQKIGIVGRTGAGKSSLIAALFRLAKSAGSVKIDDIDIQTIGLHDLRSKMSIIPQEPTLFKATLRYNLDPFCEFADDYLWAILDEVELKESFPSLDHAVNEGGSNLSVGERQLVCLARAMLRNNKIVILDEATANVDPRTDSLIQETIRRKFANCTVLTIAHRLCTVIDNDRVLVLKAGLAVEFDHPFNLLKNPDGHFTRMVDETGDTMATKLRNAAQLAYNAH